MSPPCVPCALPSVPAIRGDRRNASGMAERKNEHAVLTASCVCVCVGLLCVRGVVYDLRNQVLRRPGSPPDARSIPAAVVERDMPVWNTALVILRELCFTDQDLSER